MNLRDKSCIVYDRGFFLHVALRIAKEFRKVYYYLAEEDISPCLMKDEIGQGFDEIEVVSDFHKYLDMSDMVIFTDVYNGGDDEWLFKKGYKVASSLGSAQFEEDKKFMRET